MRMSGDEIENLAQLWPRRAVGRSIAVLLGGIALVALALSLSSPAPQPDSAKAVAAVISNKRDMAIPSARRTLIRAGGRDNLDAADGLPYRRAMSGATDSSKGGIPLGLAAYAIWGVMPLPHPGRPEADTLVDGAIGGALAAAHVQRGDTVVVTAGIPVGRPGSTNSIRVRVVE